jgi:hypothetical protein
MKWKNELKKSPMDTAPQYGGCHEEWKMGWGGEEGGANRGLLEVRDYDDYEMRREGEASPEVG